MSGLDQRERQAIVDALDEWNIACHEEEWADVLSRILGGHFAPKPEPPAGTVTWAACSCGYAMPPGMSKCVKCGKDLAQPAPQLDHLNCAQSATGCGEDGPQLAAAHALIDIAQTLRVVSAHLSKVGSEMEWVRTRGGKP